jgi:hypothetical protein
MKMADTSIAESVSISEHTNTIISGCAQTAEIGYPKDEIAYAPA